MKRFLLLITLLWPFFMMAQNPFIPKYDAVKRSERCFTITWEANNQFGSIWWAEKIDFSQDTSFNFVVYMGDRDGNGADGIAFVMHNDPRDTITDPSQQVTIGGAGTWDLAGATGDDAGGLGYAMHHARVGPNIIPGPHGPGDDPENHKIQPSVAIEFDTWNNEDVADGRSGMDANGIYQPISPYYGWDHTSVVYNGDLYGSQQIIEDGVGNSGRILPLKPSYVFGTADNPDGSPFHNIEDDQCYKYQVRWTVNPDNTQTLQLWADIYDGTTNDDNLLLIMTHTDDMISNVFGGSSLLRMGFTGSTGGSINEQTICLLGENLQPFAEDDYVTVQQNTSNVIVIEANDNDPDGDQLHVPVIIELPKHGTATIFDSLGVNFVRYTPESDFYGKDTLTYVTCDVNSTKCYAKCDTAFVFIDVGCQPYPLTINSFPSRVCSDNVVTYGRAEVMISDPKYAGNGDASFNWYESSSAFGAILYTGSFIENLSYGAYTVQAVDNVSGCLINTNVIWIDSVGQKLQNGFIEQLAPFTTCTLPHDGVLRAGIVDGVDTVNTGYSFNWYYQEDPKVPSFIQRIGSIANNLEAREYTVVITDIVTGCDTAIIAEVQNNVEIPIVTAHGSDVTTCTPPFDGHAHADVSGDTVNYVFEWYEGFSTGGDPPDFTGPDIFDLPPGQYTVQAIDKVTGCVSESRSLVINDLTSAPIVTVIQESPDYSCAGGMPTGILAPTVIGGTDGDTDIANFTISWTSGAGIPVNVDDGGGAHAVKAIDLEAGDYIIEVTDNDGLDVGCKTLRHFTLTSDKHQLDIHASVTDQTNCYANGEIEINSIMEDGNVMVLDPSKWTVTLYDNSLNDITPAGSTGFPGDPFTNLIADNYYIRIQDDATQCFSDPLAITVDDISNAPVITVIEESPDFSCNGGTPTGILAPTVFGGSDNDPGVINFLVSWTSEAGTPVKVDNGGGAFADKAIELKAGMYTITVTDVNGLDAGCINIFDIKVTSESGIVANVTDVPVSCESIFLKAGIRIEMDLDKTTVPGPYEAYVAKSDDPDNGISYQIPDDGVRTILNLDKDTYNVQIISALDGSCSFSVDVPVFGGADPLDFEVISYESHVDCETGLGSITIGNVSGDPETVYIVQLLDGDNAILESYELTSDELKGGFTIDETNTVKLVAGSYYVRVIQNQTECSGITAISDLITISQENCDLPESEITFDLAEVTAIPNEEVVVPVFVNGFENVLSAQYSINWDPNILEFSGVKSFGLQDLDANSFNLSEAGKLAFSWVPKDNIAKSLTDGTVLYHLMFNVVGNSGENAEITFTDDPTSQEVSIGTKEVVLANYLDGSVSIISGVILGGYIKTQKKEPIAGIEVELIGGMELLTTTDEAGWYQFSVYPDQEYHIAPLFDTEDDAGVTTLDIVIMQWHILGKKYIMSNQDLIASDVNGSGTLTSLDLAETRAVVLHNDGEKFRGKNSVEFINNEYTGDGDIFEYKNYLDIIPTVSHTNLDFTAVKRGDANRSWDPNNNVGGRENLLDEIEIQLEKVSSSDNIEKIALKASEFKEMVGLQFTLDWDPEVYQFKKLSGGRLHFEANLNQVNNGWLTMSWNTEQIESITLDEDAILSGLEFRRLSNNDPRLSITSLITPALAFNNQLEALKISGSELNSGLSQVESKVYPNPAHDLINVEGADLHEVYEYSIINTIGERVLYGEFTGTGSISLGNITPGIYLLKVTDSWANVSIHEIFKQ